MTKTASMIAVLLVALTAPAWAQDTPDDPSIVGIWRLDELTNYNADGTFVRPMGDRPAGTFTYTPDGHLSIQIMKVPPPAPFEGRPSETQLAETARGYLAYFGTYKIDYEEMIVTHNVEGALKPNYVNTERERAIQINGDTLEIDIHAPDGRRAYRRLTRIEAFTGASDPPATTPDFDKLTSLNRPRHHIITSEVIGRDFHLFVRLPDDYDPTGEPYPTVYLLDGDITFPMLSAYEQYLTFFDETPDVLLVGIAYGAKTQAEGNMRRWDYTAPSSERDDWGGAASFQEMLRREALPLIERAYNADSGRRILFGQSLGGQFVLYTALTQPDLFWGHIASNPAIYANPNFFLNFEFDASDRTDSWLFVVSGSDELPRYREPMRDWLAHWSGAATKPWVFHTTTLAGHSHVSIGPAAYRQGLAWLLPTTPDADSAESGQGPNVEADREVAHAHYTEGWSLILDAGRWTDSEAAFRAAMAADSTWVLGRALVARITTDLDERKAQLNWIEEHLDEADPAERLLLDLFVLNIRAANARDRGEEMPPEFAAERQALALENFRAYLDHRPTDPYISAELVEWIHHVEGVQAGLDAIQTEIHPDAAQVPFFLYYRASLLSKLSQHDEALALAVAFETALADPLAPAPHALYAQILRDMGRLEEARRRIEIAVAMDEANLSAQRLRRSIDAATDAESADSDRTSTSHADETDPVVVSPELYTVLFENEHVRIVEYAIPPGVKENPHTHPPKYMYVLEGGRLEIAPDGAAPFISEEAAGQGTWSPARSIHAAENVGATTVRVLLIEPKSAQAGENR